MQLVKANSIEGCKKTSVDVVYTEWENLKKTGDMADGQVGFHDNKKVIKVKSVPKNKDIVNRLNKTKREEYPDLAAQREKRDAQMVRIRRERAKAQAKEQAAEKAKMLAEKDARDYKHLFNDEEMTTNNRVKASEDTSAAVDFEEDFM